jgi:hypothetical protein
LNKEESENLVDFVENALLDPKALDFCHRAPPPLFRVVLRSSSSRVAVNDEGERGSHGARPLRKCRPAWQNFVELASG